MKVLKTKATSSELSSEIDLFEDIKLPLKVKRRVAREAKDILQDAILTDVGNSRSPISGENWPGLSKSYRKFKQSQNRPGKANMELSGDSLDTLDGKVSDSGRLTMGYFGDRAEIMEGHNQFQSSGGNLPKRRSLPGVGQQFKKGTESLIRDVINEAIADTKKLPIRKLQAVTSKQGLFDVLGELFPDSSRPVIVQAVLGNPDYVQRLTELGLLELLTDGKSNT